MVLLSPLSKDVQCPTIFSLSWRTSAEILPWQVLGENLDNTCYMHTYRVNRREVGLEEIVAQHERVAALARLLCRSDWLGRLDVLVSLSRDFDPPTKSRCTWAPSGPPSLLLVARHSA